MTVMFKKETKALIEALFFVSKEPLSIKELETIINIDARDIADIVEELRRDYESREAGFQIVEIAEGYQFATNSEFAPYIEKLYRPNTSGGLSKAALETLAIVAYKQPVTRGELELIRGVKIDSALTTLLDKKLIKEVGRKEGLGRPVLFGTTQEFLKYFGLKSLEDLPSPESFIEKGEEKAND